MKNKLSVLIPLCMVLGACGGEDKEQEKVSVEPDITPDAFIFSSKQDVTRGEIYETGYFTVSGIDEPVELSVENCEYSLNEEGYTGVATLVNINDSVKFKLVAPESFNSATTCEVRVGDFSSSFSAATKDALGSIKFYFSSDLNDSNEQVNAEIAYFYADYNSSGNFDRITKFEGNEIVFDSEVPSRYTAVFHAEVKGRSKVVAYTSDSISTEGEVVLSSGYRITNVNDNCKSVTVDATEAISTYNAENIRLVGPALCDYRKETGVNGVITTRVSTEDDERNSLLASIYDSDGNYLAYKFLSPSKLVGDDTYIIDDFITNFTTVEVTNHLDVNRNLEVRSHELRDNGFDLAEYDYIPANSSILLNVIDSPTGEYYIGLYDAEFYGETTSLQSNWSELIVDFIPDTISTDSTYRKVSHLSYNYDGEIEISWSGIGLTSFDKASIVVEGWTEDGNELFWLVDTDNSGMVKLPYLSEIGVLYSSYSLNTVNLQMRAVDDESKTEYGVSATDWFYCEDDFCSSSVTFE